MKFKNNKPRRAEKPARIVTAERLNELHAMTYAALSLTTFIVTFILSIMLGAWGVLPFVYAGGAMLAILLIEALLRGKLWPFEPGFRETFGHPEISYRILVFCGTFLLLLESAILLHGMMANR